METLTETIDRMLKEREAKKLFPIHITLVDLKNERAKIDEEELKSLNNDGDIEITRILNGFAIEKRV